MLATGEALSEETKESVGLGLFVRLPDGTVITGLSGRVLSTVKVMDAVGP